MAHKELPFGECFTTDGVTIINDLPGYIGLAFDSDGGWKTIVVRRQGDNVKMFIGSMDDGVTALPPEPEGRLTPWQEGYAMGYAEGHRFGRQEGGA